MNGRPWTDREHRELREMYEAGVPCREMALRLGRSLKAIYARCIFAGVNRGPMNRKRKWTPAELETVRRMFAAGRPDAEIARATGRSAAAVTEMRHCMGLVLREHRRWTPEERLRLRRMRLEGISYATAALVLGRTAGAAAKQFRNYVKGKYI